MTITLSPCHQCGAEVYHRDGCVSMLADIRLAREVRPEQRTRGRPEPRGPGLRFQAHERVIMRGAEHVATAMSHNFARRIANALNTYTPNERGY